MRTLLIASVAVYFAVAFVLTYVWMRRRVYPGFGWWMASSWVGILGVGLIASRGHLPETLTVLVGNVLVVAVVVLVAAGLTLFAGGMPDWKGYGALLALVALFMAHYLWLQPSLRIRILGSSLLIAGLCFRSAHLAWRRVPVVLAGANQLAPVSLLGLGLVYLFRGLLALSVVEPTQDFLAPSLIQGLALLASLVGHICMTTGLIVLNAQRVEHDLQVALEECKVLRGILPICATCKKIRDDQGAWNQVEAYIRQHTDAEFTHGICPDCARNFYPKGGGAV
jgi:hypothetical protein